MGRLREHLRRLRLAAHELSHSPVEGRWHVVAHNLGLAQSLTDLFADTDIDNSSMWCGPAPEYESADAGVAAGECTGGTSSHPFLLHLRGTVLAAFEVDTCGTYFGAREMR